LSPKKKCMRFVNTRIVIPLAFLITFLSAAVAISSATVSVGVKKGDWIEYQVSSTGTLDPEHSIVSAKMEVLSVQGLIVKVGIVSTFSDGTQVSTNATLNLETGDLVDNFVIPAGLAVNDEFYDAQARSNITITGVEQRTYIGAMRTVVSATIDISGGYNTYIWDQATGVCVEGNAAGTDYTVHSKATATNMWSYQTSASNMTFIYAVVAIAVIVIAVTILYIKRLRKDKI
jgi:hypothetical protein